jgi:hypothetical protein
MDIEEIKEEYKKKGSNLMIKYNFNIKKKVKSPNFFKKIN